MTIQESLHALLKDGSEMYCKICTVDSIDQSARTVDVTPIDEGAPILSVNLQANQDSEVGIVAWPRQGSHVVVAFLNAATGVVVLTEDVERVEITVDTTTVEIDSDKAITLNGGGLGGLVKVEALTDKLNALKDEINSLVLKFNSHTHTTTATVGISGPATVAPTTSKAQNATAFMKADYENNKIKHGE